MWQVLQGCPVCTANAGTAAAGSEYDTPPKATVKMANVSTKLFRCRALKKARQP